MRLEDAMVRVFQSPDAIEYLTDEHLILSVNRVYGLRRGCQENLESAAEARHNRRYFACGFDYFLLDEVSRGNHLAMRAIDRLAYQVDLVARFNGRVADYLLQLGHFTLDQRQGFGDVQSGRRDMAGNCIELFRNLLTLHGDLLALFAEKSKSFDQRFQLLFQAVHGLYSATHVQRHKDHRNSDGEKRHGHNYQHPKRRIVRIQLKRERSHGRVNRQYLVGTLAGFIAVVWRCFDTAREFRLTFLFLIGLLARFDCGRDCADLTSGGFACLLGHVGYLFAGGRIKL